MTVTYKNLDVDATGMDVKTGVKIGPYELVYDANNFGRALRVEGNGSVTMVVSGIPYVNDTAFTGIGRAMYQQAEHVLERDNLYGSRDALL